MRESPAVSAPRTGSIYLVGGRSESWHLATPGIPAFTTLPPSHDQQSHSHSFHSLHSLFAQESSPSSFELSLRTSSRVLVLPYPHIHTVCTVHDSAGAPFVQLFYSFETKPHSQSLSVRQHGGTRASLPLLLHHSPVIAIRLELLHV